MLVDPRFVFRFEREPDNVPAGNIYRVSDLELASRLSFFLWSSILDDELLNRAVAGKLHDPSELEQQARRMLADPRPDSLAANFAGQWLYLRELKNKRPEAKDLDENLRQAFRQETELFFGSIQREDRNGRVIDGRCAPRTAGARKHPAGYLRGDQNLTGRALDSEFSRTSWARRRPGRPRMVPPLKESAGHTQPVPCGCGWKNIAPIPSVRLATRSWTRSASRLKTSIWSASGEPPTAALGSMRPANWWMAPDWMDLPASSRADEPVGSIRTKLD